MDTITAWWNGWLVGVFSGFFDMIAKVLISVGTLSAALIHWAPVVNAMTTVQVFATAVLGLKVGLDVYSRYILQLSGEDGDPLDSVLIRAAGAATLIWSIPLAVTLAVDVGNKLTSDVLTNSAAGAVTSKLQAADVMKRLVAIGLTGANPTGQLLLAVVMLFLSIGLIVIFFQVTKRSVELAIMVFIGPVLALNFASPDRSLFAAWTRQLLTLAFTQALQLYLLNLTIIGLVTGLKISGFGTDPVHEFVAMIGLMACTIALPAFVRQMTHQAAPTGVGSMARMATFEFARFAVARAG
jgi:hypothetical protein